MADTKKDFAITTFVSEEDGKDFKRYLATLSRRCEATKIKDHIAEYVEACASLYRREHDGLSPSQFLYGDDPGEFFYSTGRAYVIWYKDRLTDERKYEYIAASNEPLATWLFAQQYSPTFYEITYVAEILSHHECGIQSYNRAGIDGIWQMLKDIPEEAMTEEQRKLFDQIGRRRDNPVHWAGNGYRWRSWLSGSMFKGGNK